VATTYTRIKNRRGLRADLPQPLADGEIGLATDTREVYIGAGTQDLLNSDVQVTPFLDAQTVVSGDLTNIDSATTNNGLLFFNVTGTQTFTGDGTNKNSYTISSANVSIPSGKSPIGSSYESQDFVVTKYINGNPTLLETSKYSIVNSGGNYQINFITAPEAGSKVCVVKWTEAQTREHARARASWEASNSAVSSYNKWQANDLANNQVWVDITTGTGMVQFVTAGEKTALETANANDSISTINEPATYSFLGENTTLGHVARNVAIDSDLKIDLDTPQQAYNVSRFINKKRGQVSRVANNIQIYTEASYPQFQTNQYVSFMRKATLAANSNGTVLSYVTTEANIYKVDYSVKYNNEFRAGTILIATDGTNATINDNFVETGDTSAVSFAAAISSGKLQWNWANSHATNVANLSYKIERWLQS
tara:strand:+ start:720 stop:1988 length:1269 start_codon:yes stop_codon:yes gene_type:complete